MIVKYRYKLLSGVFVKASYKILSYCVEGIYRHKTAIDIYIAKISGKAQIKKVKTFYYYGFYFKQSSYYFFYYKHFKNLNISAVFILLLTLKHYCRKLPTSSFISFLTFRFSTTELLTE